MLETMQTQKESSAVKAPLHEIPNYWPLYGLNQPPFEESHQPTMYYPLPQWQQILDYLHQLPNSTNRLTLITGALGVGKTMSIVQYMSDNFYPLPLCLLKSHVAIHVSDLLHQVTTNFGLSFDPTDNPSQAQIKLLAELQQQQKHGILLVDDAHRLPLESLSALIQLTLEQTTDSIHLFVVLLGESQLANRVKNLMEILGNNIESPLFNLRSLNLEETKDYIKHRLIKAGLDPNTALNESILIRIYRLSGGIPGKINRIAQQYLTDILPKCPDYQAPSIPSGNKNNNSRGKVRKFFSRFLGILLTIGILGSVLNYIFNFHEPPINDQPKHVNLTFKKLDAEYQLPRPTPLALTGSPEAGMRN